MTKAHDGFNKDTTARHQKTLVTLVLDYAAPNAHMAPARADDSSAESIFYSF
jgi:hypothetical protein